jgi:hypothetical protein
MRTTFNRYVVLGVLADAKFLVYCSCCICLPDPPLVCVRDQQWNTVSRRAACHSEHKHRADVAIRCHSPVLNAITFFEPVGAP